MERQYNWNLVLIVSVPIAIIETYIFYKNISNAWKWVSLLLGLFLASGIVYVKDKKKENVFTAAAIVFLVSLIVKFMKQAGFF